MAESILKIHTQNGDIPVGYPGLADKPISDKTLSKEGAFADSKAVGDKFKEVKAETDSLKEDLEHTFILRDNLVNPNAWIENKAVYPDTGIVYDIEGWKTQKISVKGHSKLFRNYVNATLYAFYTENGEFISGHGELLPEFSIPANASSMQICTNDFQNIDKASISKNNKFVKYGYDLNENISVKDESLKNTTLKENVDFLLGRQASSIVCWGDSLTAGAGATPIVIDGLHGATMPSTLAHLLGYGLDDSVPGYPCVYNMGVGGESSITIACRQGGLLMFVNGITIPADGQVTFSHIYCQDGQEVFPCRQDWYGQRKCFMGCDIGGVKGNLSYSTETNMYIFERTESGKPLTINRPTKITTPMSNEMRGNILIVEIGHNGGWKNDYEYLIGQYRDIIEWNGTDKYIVIGDSDGTAESKKEWEYALQKAFGNHFFNNREYLSKYGLSDRGLIPTEDDKEKMLVGEIPLQLKSDATHYNSYGYFTQGEQIYKRGKELGYW